MATYFIRFAFVCSDVPYRRHLVYSVEANSLIEAVIRAQEDRKNLGNDHELISVHNFANVQDVIPAPFGAQVRKRTCG